ncbi:hypothetical protein G6F56_010808 [Rhizopus delemar]|nr:hypothetical protein G6F56_010808 [Rhizopus delemar]
MYGNKVAPFNNIQHALTLMFAREGFESLIEVWRGRTRHQDTMYDIYDGQLWSEFLDKDGQVFTAQSRSLMFTLNVDWFQPSKGVTYSVGALYLTINNLPRHLRYKRENVILVCMTPGPREPSTTQLNNYLQVLVDQLNALYYDDFQVCTAQSPNRPVSVRAALALIACDIPASRKVSGFTSFNATVPCNKCETVFPPRDSTALQRNFAYGLENCESWVLRTNASNRQHALKWKEAATERKRGELEKLYGTRFSALHNLPYLDIVRSTSVDPMHGLFLGTAKRMVKIWRTHFNNDTNSVYLTDSDLVEMQAEADQIVLPQQYTPIRRKIGSKFSDMKADEWRTWCLAYSPYLLKGRLPVSHKNNWALFVQACHIVCRPSITIADAWSAHQLFQKFAIGVARLYGNNAVSPNMHLHLHLLESIRDFGPIYSFWVYGFERFCKWSTLGIMSEACQWRYKKTVS